MSPNLTQKISLLVRFFREAKAHHFFASSSHIHLIISPALKFNTTVIITVI